MRVRHHLKSFWQIVVQTFDDFLEYRALRMSAALAYYTAFSIAPMLLVIITLCDIFYGRAAIEGHVYYQIKSYVGPDAAAQIQQLLKSATISGGVSWASVVGVITLVFASTAIFGEIQDAINLIWRLKVKPKNSFLKLLFNRALSFSMVIGLGFVLLVSLVIDALLDTLSGRLMSHFPEVTLVVAHAVNFAITFGTISLLFASIFKVLPDARVQWRDVWIGSFTTAGLFMLGKFIIGYYLGRSKIGSTYGAAGSIVIILLWVYYSSIILYFGAAFTRAYSQAKGRNILPNDYAVYIQQVEVESKAPLPEQPESKTTVPPQPPVDNKAES